MGEFNVDVIIDDKELKEYIVHEFAPEDVYPIDELDTWARENGYIKESEIDYEAWAEKNGYVKE